MIDFKTKTFYFGYGDIFVGSEYINLRFREFEPPIEVGTAVNEASMNELGLKYTSDKVTICFCSYEEAKCFSKLLNSMDGKDNFQFDFKGWRFNFSNWNPKSIECIKTHLNTVRSYLLMCTAC